MVDGLGGLVAGNSVGRRNGKGGLSGEYRIDIDLDRAQAEADRIRSWLRAMRVRYDLARFEYTLHVRIVPAGPTFSHPILTLGTRFTETEDQLLATYLHEQMHWYLHLLGGPDHDPIEPVFDELVRRYPAAPIRLPDGGRNFEQTYVHLVVNWLELEATAQFIGWERTAALADTQYGYRWIYKTVIRDREDLRTLFADHGIAPIIPADRLRRGADRQKTPSAASPPPARPARRRPRARDGKSAD